MKSIFSFYKRNKNYQMQDEEKNKTNKVSHQKFMNIGAGTIEVLPIDILLMVNNLNQLNNNLMRRIPFYNNIKLPLRMSTLIILSLLGIED